MLNHYTSGPDNTDRAMWAREAVDAYAAATRNDPAEQRVEDAEALTEVLGDLLCDLRHLANMDGVDFEALVGHGRDGWREEIAEDTEDPVHITIQTTVETTVTVPAADLDAAADGWRGARDYIDLSEEAQKGIHALTDHLLAAEEPDRTIAADIVNIEA